LSIRALQRELAAERGDVEVHVAAGGMDLLAGDERSHGRDRLLEQRQERVGLGPELVEPRRLDGARPLGQLLGQVLGRTTKPMEGKR
jgi:hypothetical protein